MNPNIYGEHSARLNVYFGGLMVDKNGAFYHLKAPKQTKCVGIDYTLYDDNSKVGFSSDYCSSVYGNSNTVQPNAIRTYYIIKF